MRWLVALLAFSAVASAAPSTADVVGLAVGDNFSCAVHADGAVSCWGANERGQLGDGTKLDRDTPVRVAEISDAVEVAADGERACARRRDGTVACWGMLATTSLVDKPTSIPATDVVQLAGSCMRTKTGAQCLSARAQVVEVLGAADAVDIAGSASRGCIARKRGTVACWFAPNDLHTIAGVVGAAKVAIDNDQACALGKDGGVTCWAWGFQQVFPSIKVPNPDARPRPPVQLPVRPTRVAVARTKELLSAGARVCARTARDVRCWSIDHTVTPAVSGLGASERGSERGPVTAVAIRAHGCAVRGGRDVVCWGPGGSGQLGFGWKDGHAEPIAVPGITDAVELAASFSPGTGSSQWTCARRRGGQVACWGNVSPHNTPGGDAVPRDVGKAAVRLVRGMVAGFIDGKGAWSNLVAGGGYHYRMPPMVDAAEDCAVAADHRVLCAGEHRINNDFFNHPDRSDGEGIAIEGITDAAQLAIGSTHACARGSGGAVTCFDRQGATTRVAGIDAIDIASGAYTSCAVRRDHGVTCWGPYKSAVLPNGGVTPVDIPGLSNVTSITMGDDHACAREADGTVWCWGANQAGQLGDGTRKGRAWPAQVAKLAGVTQVAAGTHHTCALLESGAVKCWGEATSGAIGSYMMEYVATPVAVTW